jgi:MFS family permease
VFGWLADHWIAAGATPTRARKTIAVAGLAGAGVALVACSAQDATGAIVFLCVAKAFHGACSSNQWAIWQTLPGNRAVGRWIGMQNCFGNFSGIIAPAITGFIVDATGSFVWPFAITASVAIAGAASILFVVGPVHEVQWPIRMSMHRAA